MDKDPRTRDEWSRPVEFLLSSIAMSVGFGIIIILNVIVSMDWIHAIQSPKDRFPYIAYLNGGGAFLLPYLVVLLLIGKPIYFMELAIGQFSSYGPVKIWKMVPILKGIGYGSMMASICGASYYCSVMAIVIYYLAASFQQVLPWTECDPAWTFGFCPDSNSTVHNDMSPHHHRVSNKSLPQLYFENHVMQQKDNIEDGLGGWPTWQLTCCLLTAWAFIFITLIRGVKSSGKFAYVFAVFPYFVLITLLIRALMLPGSWDGVKYFITPQWEKLIDLKVWFSAVTQCFFSLGMGFGPIIMNASYNSFRHNVYRDAMIISFMDTFTSMLAGFTIFATLGSLAFEMNTDVSRVALTGPGLAFISYPQAVSKFGGIPQIFSVLFFLMMLSLGIGTALSVVGGIVTIICDQFPKFRRIYVTIIVAIVGFLLGLIYLTPGGQFVMTLVDTYGASFIIFIMALLEVIGIVFIYGLDNFCHDIEFMLNIRIGLYWKICWKFIVPISLLIILSFTVITAEKPTHNGVELPSLAIVCGYILSATILSLIPICGIHSILTRKPASSSSSMSLLAKLKNSLKPSKDWGPMNSAIREEWLGYQKEEIPLSSTKSETLREN